MRIIISPAKKMNIDTDSLKWCDFPSFLPQTKQLLAKLQSLTYDELKKLWACNDKIAMLNFKRLQNMNLEQDLTPALLSYEGLQYQHMAPTVFTYDELDYVLEHLRILSGFYGILKPLDGVTPYRLEMQAKLSACGKTNLYDFWGDSLAKHLEEETDTILNLASFEYSKAVSVYFTQKTKMITCVFGERKADKIIEKGTLCKMARGEMVRFMAEKQITHPEEIQSFDRLKFRFHPELSGETTYYFIKE